MADQMTANDRGDYVVSINELGSNIQTELNQCVNWAGSEYRESIKQSLNYMLLRQKGDEIDGRSKIQSGDVADIVDHVHAEIQPMYNVDTLCEVGEEGPEDEEQARVETEALNWYWRERMRGAERLDEAIQDGLLSRNGYLKIYFQKSYGLPYEQEIEGDPLQIQAELEQLSQESEVEIVEAEVTQEAQYMEVAALPYDDPMALPVVQAIEVAPEQLSVTVKVTPVYQEVLCDSIAPEDSYVSRDAVGSNMQQMRFWAHRRRMTKQDIKALGFYGRDVDIMPVQNEKDEDVRTSRQSDNNVYFRQAARPEGYETTLYECYYKLDRDGDGIPEMWKVFTSSTGDVLRWDDNGEPGEYAAEMVRVRPVASGSPMKMAHRHQGRSLYDKEAQIEDTKRQMIRQMLDNLAEANNTTTVYAEHIADEDIEETEVGRAIRARNPGADVVAFKHNNIVTDSLQGLQYMDKIRKERAGTAIDMSAENVPVQQAAHSTERIMSAMERVVGMYAQNFANNLIRDAFVLLHQQMQLMPGKVAFKDGDQWAETEPRYWVQRNRISVTLGKSAGDKMRYAVALRDAIQIQREDAQGGMGILVNYQNMYNARYELYRNAGLDDPQQYVLDPESPEAQQQMMQDQQNAERERQAQMRQQDMLYETQMRMVQMQEATKRMSDQSDAIQNSLDRWARFVTEMTKIEADTGADLPAGELGVATPETAGLLQ